MRLIFSFLIIVFAIAVLANLGQMIEEGLKGGNLLQEDTSQESSEEQLFSESSGLASIVNPISRINTYIKTGPKEGEIIEDTNIVTFEFGANSSLEGKISYETKIEGLDDDWKRTSSPERTVTLPPSPKEYTFLVRAKTGNSTDPTPAKRTFKANISPYFGKVKITSVRTSDPSLITLKANLNEEEVNITGWEVEGRRGKATVPQGIKRYLPGYDYADKDIFIEDGDVIYLSSDSNPLGKKRDFRLNKCFGYLARLYDFTTPVPGSCPKPGKDEVSHLKICCREYLLKTSRCETPDYSKNPRIAGDFECVSFIEERFSYEGCFRSHFQDEDFLKNSWHIYLKSNVVTRDYCDTIYLRDQNNLLVDEYSYGKDVCR